MTHERVAELFRARFLRVPINEVRDYIERTGEVDSKNVYYRLRSRDPPSRRDESEITVGFWCPMCLFSRIEDGSGEGKALIVRLGARCSCRRTT